MSFVHLLLKRRGSSGASFYTECKNFYYIIEAIKRNKHNWSSSRNASSLICLCECIRFLEILCLVRGWEKLCLNTSSSFRLCSFTCPYILASALSHTAWNYSYLKSCQTVLFQSIIGILVVWGFLWIVRNNFVVIDSPPRWSNSEIFHLNSKVKMIRERSTADFCC